MRRPGLALEDSAEKTIGAGRLLQRNKDLRQVEISGNSSLNRLLVRCWVREAERKGQWRLAARVAARLSRKGRDTDRIKAAAQEDAGSPEAQVTRHRCGEELVELLELVSIDPSDLFIVRHWRPVAVDPPSVRAPDEHVPRRDAANRRKVRLIPIRPVMGQMAGQSGTIYLVRNTRVTEEGGDGRGEEKLAPGVGIEEGVQAHPVAGAEHAPSADITNHERVDPLQLVEHPVAPAVVCRED